MVTALGDKTLSAAEKKALVELEVKLQRQDAKVADAQSHFLESVAPYRIAGAATGIKNLTVESITEVASLVKDLATFPMSAESRAALVDRAVGIAAIAQNPELIKEYYSQQCAEADRLERNADFEGAAAIRTKVAGELLSMLSDLFP